MPKTVTPTQTKPFTVTLPKQAVAMLDQLKVVGLHGSNRAEIARSLILSRLEQLVANGIVSRPSEPDE
jgi:hypothetical protein